MASIGFFPSFAWRVIREPSTLAVGSEALSKFCCNGDVECACSTGGEVVLDDEVRDSKFEQAKKNSIEMMANTRSPYAVRYWSITEFSVIEMPQGMR